MSCPLCGAGELSVQYVLPDPNYKTVKCRNCDFVFMDPYPSDQFLAEFYRSRELYGFDVDEDVSHYTRIVEDRRDLIRNLLARYGGSLGHGHAVDFGAGIGMAVAALENLGFQALGLDSNPRSPAIAARLFGVQILNRDLTEIPGDIRLLTMFDVLEHIKYPVDFLRSLRERLADSAYIIGSVPNYRGLGRYLHGTKSAALTFPEHLSQFTRATLERAMADAGFQILYAGFPPPYGVTISMNLRKWLMRRFGSSKATKAASDMVTKIKKHAVYPPQHFCREHRNVGTFPGIHREENACGDHSARRGQRGISRGLIC